MLAQQSMSLDTPSTIILKTRDQTASGDTDEFLSSKLKFTKDENGQEICVVDAGGEEVGVMMGWERDISERNICQCRMFVTNKGCHSAGDCETAVR
jgi:protein arginine N-methyltransferase 2